MKNFLKKLFDNFGRSFGGYNFLFHLLAILLTYLLVKSGFDWGFYQSTRGPVLQSVLFPAVIIGSFLPIFLPLLLLIFHKTRYALALMQAEFLGWFISAIYKSLTGRVHPSFADGDDISGIFHFGFMKGGIFWGWPSSHTIVAFAGAFCLFVLFPRSKLIRFLSVLYAFYVGIGVSTNIHWFSDFVAGAIMGTVVGVVVGRSFFIKKN